MNSIRKWLLAHQFLFSILSSLAILSFVFDFVWAIVLLSTVYLVEATFATKDITTKTDTKKQTPFSGQQEKNYQLGELSDEDIVIPVTEAISMFRYNDQKNNPRLVVDGNGKPMGESKPSLMSLIQGKKLTPASKENRSPYRQQKQHMLAVVQNNMSILQRRSSSSYSSYPKSPLYRNMQSPVIGRTYPVNHTIAGPPNNFNSYSSDFLDVQRPKTINNSNTSFSELNNSFNGGLEVHGSYFINKSLLHEEEEEVESFSLVNKNFQSPYKTKNQSFSEKPQLNISRTAERLRNSQYMMNQTSTEAVVSVLKEKSKRKRQYQTEQDIYSAKKMKLNQDTFDSTLNELFPPVNTNGSPLRRRISSLRSSKKRLVSTATQCDSPEEEEHTEVKKLKTTESPSPGRSRFGLSERQTDEMMTETVFNETPAKMEKLQDSDNSVLDSSLSENVDGHVKESLKSYPGSTKKVSFHVNSTVNNIDELDDSTLGSPSSKKTALKNLKSPYKKLFNTSFPSNLLPGTTEKRRRHPVYFTARIDIDEIQNNREEYGQRGASLKAFRLDQKEAAERVNDLLDDTDEADFKKAPITSTTSILQTSITSENPTLKFNNSTSSLTTIQPATTVSIQSNGLLSTQKQPISASPQISFTSATPTTNISFKLDAASITNTTPVESSTTLSFSLTTTALTTSTSLPSSLSSLPLASSKSVSFAFGSTSQNSTGMTFGSTATSLNAPALTTKPAITTQVSSGFSFGSAPVSSQNQPSVSTSAFSFGIAGLTSSSTLPTTSSVVAPKIQSSFQFGSTQSTVTTSVSSATPNVSFGATSSAQPSASTGFSFTPQLTAGSNLLQSTNSSSGSGFSFGSASSVSFGAPSQLSASVSIPNVTSTLTSFTNTTKPTQFSFGSSNPLTTVNAFSTSQTNTSNAPVLTSNIFANISKPEAILSQSSNMFSTGTSTKTTTASVFGNLPTQSGTSGFNFGATTSNTSASVFGAPVTSTSAPSVFGITATSGQNLFGMQPTTSVPSSQTVFGINNPNSSQSVFGVPAVSTQSIFGATTNTTSVFGSVTSTQSIFGAPAASNTFGTASSGNPFGTSSTASVFGAPTTQSAFGAPTTQSAFGAPTTQSAFGAPTTQSAFGAPTTQSAFGAPTTQSAFGATTTQSSFGAPTTQSAFGAAPSSSASIFGQPSNQSTGFQFGPTTTKSNQSTGFNFGAVSQSSVFGQSTGNNAFGSTNNQNSVFGATSSAIPTPFGSSNAANTGSVFGAPTTAASTINPFNKAQQAGGFDFSTSMKPSFNFAGQGAGTTNAFGSQSTAAVKPFNFNTQQATPGFGSNPATPSFGTPQQPSFATPQAAPAFGTPNFNTPGAGGFTIGAGNSNPAGRQTQRARRRLRK